MKTIGKYQLFAEIHQGPITTLYKAFQSQLDRVVIIKQLNPERIGDKDLIDRFQQEGLIIAKINHPNVINIFDYGIHNNAPYLVMEFIEGVTLAQVIEEQNVLPIDIAIFLMHQISSGLFALHQKNFIHRDIKPANILLSNDGAVKIGDFGFAESKLNSDNFVLGTPSYMSPEIVLSQKVDEQSDIFSLGIVFYELLSSENPFYATKASTILKNIVNVTPPALNKVRPLIPEKIASICHKMLNKNPEQRYASLKPIIKELDVFTKNFNSESLINYLHNSGEYIETPLESVSLPPEPKKKRKYFHYIYAPMILIGVILILIFIIRPNLSKRNIDEPLHSNINEPSNDSIPILLSDSLQTVSKIQTTEKFTTISNLNSSHKELLIPDIEIPVTDNTSVNHDFFKPVSISISCDPRAKIFINGDSVGISPVAYMTNTIPANLQLMLINPGLPLINKDITINTVSDTVWHISLWQEVGYLHVSVNPWGEIWLDGDSIDVTPLLNPLILAPGNHQLDVRHPQLKPKKESIFIVAGDTLRKSIILTKAK